MVNLECQSNTPIFNRNHHPTRYLAKMSSSVNLYAYLTHNISTTTSSNAVDDDDGSDNDLSIDTNPLAMTSSESSDSAIVSDEIDELDLNTHQSNECGKSRSELFDKTDLSFSSLSQSFYLLNQIDQQNIYDNYSSMPKYKRPLPRTNVTPTYSSSNKVFVITFSMKTFPLKIC